MDNKSFKMVYTITERGERTYWHRIGIAHVNRDGSLNVTLDAMPVNGTLHVRDWKPRDEDQERNRLNGGPRSASSQPIDDLPGAF